MPLSNSNFNVHALTEAINLIPKSPNILDGLGLFKQEFKTTTYVEIERAGYGLNLVENRPRGAVGDPVGTWREPPKLFKMMHLVCDDIVRADDVQNIRAFGTTSVQAQVAQLVNDKLAVMKENFDYTREHAMFGALKGKILDKDGATIITDIYQEFGQTRVEHEWNLSNASTDIVNLIDTYSLDIAKRLQGESANGSICLISPNFYNELIKHKSVKDVYYRYNQADLYRQEGVGFAHKGVKFVVYGTEFESGLKLGDDEAIILPLGTKKTFREYFAPADMNGTVNSVAKAYYASREKLPHDKGWSLHSQSNPLPLVLRPDLVQTIRLT